MIGIGYVVGAELPDVGITWYATDGTVIDFASGWTFQVKIGVKGSAALLTKTAGIVGAATAPNITIVWTAGELDAIPSGVYTLQVRATSASKDRIFQDLIRITSAVT